MHIIHDEIGLPGMTWQASGQNTALFSIFPLPNGYGMTLGNALRRVLLSSVPGAAITAVKVKGITHEYTTLTGMKDSILDLCLNLKEVSFQKYSSDAEICSLSAKKAGDVLAKDISASSDIEILTPEKVLTTLSDKNDGLHVDIKIEKGVGYLPAASQQVNKEEEHWVYLDATFSPVVRVRYDVTATRVGENTNLDKLEIEVETNGSLSPEDAMKFSAKVLSSYFDLFQKDQESIVEEDFMANTVPAHEGATEEEDTGQESYTPIEVLNFSPRTLNALINGEIGSIEDLVRCTPARLENLRGFGKKAMDEVFEILAARNLSLTKDE